MQDPKTRGVKHMRNEVMRIRSHVFQELSLQRSILHEGTFRDTLGKEWQKRTLP